MALARPDMVLLDLDGTLVDSAPDIAFCVDAMLQRMDLPSRGEDKVRRWVGNGAERLVHRALCDDAEGMADPETFARAYALFSDLYEQNTSKRSRLYPGAREGLDFLRGSNVKLGCVTNKRGRFTEPLLRALGILNDFDIVISGDTLPKKKPDPMPLLHASEMLGAKPENALMIGDSLNDIEAARAAGFQVVAVSYGYNQGRDIAAARPDAVVDSLARLPDLF
jgi:phosphoglycolate phosphatase